MKVPYSFMLISTFLAFGMLFSNCDNVSSLADEEGEFDTHIPMEKLRYDLSDHATDAVIKPKFINRSDENLSYMTPTETTLQKFDGSNWKDLGRWYGVLAVAPRCRSLESGESLEAIQLDIHSVAENTDMIRSSGHYRIHFGIYKGEDCQEHIPVSDRVSDPFEIIL